MWNPQKSIQNFKGISYSENGSFKIVKSCQFGAYPIREVVFQGLHLKELGSHRDLLKSSQCFHA